MSIEAWLVFVGIWTLAGLPLGPNALNCIAVSAEAGFVRALWAVVGILLAALCHMAAVIFGLAALLLASAEAFAVLKLAGAAYLVWMGVTTWRRAGLPPRPAGSGDRTAWRIVRRAFLISMSNPKAVLSYFAVFAQFVTPAEAGTGALAILVTTALAVTAAIYLGYCLLGRAVGRLLRQAARLRLFNRAIGAFYVVAGVLLAVADFSPAGRRAATATPA